MRRMKSIDYINLGDQCRIAFRIRSENEIKRNSVALGETGRLNAPVQRTGPEELGRPTGRGAQLADSLGHRLAALFERPVNRFHGREHRHLHNGPPR